MSAGSCKLRAALEHLRCAAMDECQHELDFEELEKLCRHTPEDELSEAEADQLGETGGTEEGGGAGERFRDMVSPMDRFYFLSPPPRVLSFLEYTSIGWWREFPRT